MEAAAMPASKFRSVALSILRLRVRQIGFALGAAVVSAVGATLVSLLVDGGRSVDEAYRSTAAGEGAALLFASALIVAPLVETLVLAWILLLLLDRGINRHIAVLLSAMLWTVIHSFRGLSGLSVCFPFIIYSYLFVERRNPPRADGFLLAAMAHFFYNLIVLTAAYCGGLI